MALTDDDRLKELRDLWHDGHPDAADQAFTWLASLLAAPADTGTGRWERVIEDGTQWSLPDGYGMAQALLSLHPDGDWVLNCPGRDWIGPPIHGKDRNARFADDLREAARIIEKAGEA